MEALAELVVAIIGFFLEVTVHALVFIWLLLMAAFSPKYREKLKHQWTTSTSNRIAITLGLSLYSIAFIFALLFWISACRSTRVPTGAQNAEKSANTISFSKEEMHKLEETKKIGELVDTARVLIEQRFDKRRQPAENATGLPSPADASK
jgi:TRAP-type C4-dicarboxylate transport system permease small subunit